MHYTNHIIPWGSNPPTYSVSLERRVVKVDSPLAKAATLMHPAETRITKKVPGCVSVLLDRMNGQALVSCEGIDEHSVNDAYWQAAHQGAIVHNSNFTGPLFTMKRNAKFYECVFFNTCDITILRIFVFDAYFKLGKTNHWYEMGRFVFEADECWLEKPNGELTPHAEKILHIEYVSNYITQAVVDNVQARSFVLNWASECHSTKIDKLVPQDIKAALETKDRENNISSVMYHRFQYFGTKDYWDWCLMFDENRMYKFRYNRHKHVWASTRKPLPNGFELIKKGKTGTILDNFTGDTIHGYALDVGLKSPDIAKYSNVFQINGCRSDKIPEDFLSVKKLFGVDGKMLVRALFPVGEPVYPRWLSWDNIARIKEMYTDTVNKGVDPQTAINFAVTVMLDYSVFSCVNAAGGKGISAEVIRYLMRLKQSEFSDWYGLREYYQEYRASANRWEDLLVERGYKSAPKYFPECVKPSRLKDTMQKAYRSAKEWHDYCYTLQNKDIDEQIQRIANCSLIHQLTHFPSDEFCWEVPHNSMDLVREGTALDHCVGRMGYNRRIATGESIILFLREKSSPDTPFYTIELCPKDENIFKGWYMRQCYTFHDGIEKTPECRAYIDAWLKAKDISNRAVY